MEVADFLLARIADEEEEAPYVHHENCDSLDESPCDCPWPERIKAECEAKRRIVEWCSERSRVYIGRLGDDPTDPKNYMPGDYVHQDDAPVLRLLALPYADHPDYREQWRP